MAGGTVVLRNGVLYTYANLQNISFGVPVTGIKAISYLIKQDKQNIYADGTAPIGRSYGILTYEDGKITVLKDWWQSVVNAAPFKNPLFIPPFDWTVILGNAAPGLPPVATITETLKAFEFLADPMSSQQGDNAIWLDVPFIFADKITT